MSKSKMTESMSGNAAISAQTASQETEIPIQEQLPTYIDVRINSIRTSGPVKAYVSATLNGCFAIRGLKIVQGEHGPFVSMPSSKTEKGYQDICFPCTKEFREQLHATVMEAYQQELAQMGQRSQDLATPQQTMG